MTDEELPNALHEMAHDDTYQRPPGGKALSSTEAEHLRLEAARLDRRGYNQTQIAKMLGVSQPMVNKYLAIIRARYRKAILEERSAMVQEKLEQLRDVRREAWESWEKSKGDHIRVVEECAPPPIIVGRPAKRKDKEQASQPQPTNNEPPALRTVRRTILSEVRHGDPRFLQTILETFRDERALLGLDMPTKVDMRGQVAVISIDWDKIPVPNDPLAEKIAQSMKLLPEGTINVNGAHTNGDAK